MTMDLGAEEIAVALYPLDSTSTSSQSRIQTFDTPEHRAFWSGITYVDATTVLLAAPTSPVVKLDLTTGQVHEFAPFEPGVYWGVTYDPTTDLVYIACKGLCVRVVDRTGKEIKRLEETGSGFSTRGLAVSESKLIVTGTGFDLRVYDKTTLQFERTMFVGSESVGGAIAPCPRIDYKPKGPFNHQVWIVPTLVTAAVVLIAIVAFMWYRKTWGWSPSEKRTISMSKFLRQAHGLHKAEADNADMIATRYAQSAEPSTQLKRGPESVVIRKSPLNSFRSMPADDGSVLSLASVTKIDCPAFYSRAHPGPLPSLVKECSKSSLHITNMPDVLPDDCDLNEIPPGDITVSALIDGGSTADVYRGRWLGLEVGIKILRESPDEVHDKLIKRALTLLSQLRHPNICQILGVVQFDRIAIVMPYREKGSLYTQLRHMRQGTEEVMDFARTFSIARDIACGLRFLHENDPPIIHCDVKSPNILLDQYMQASITDFGITQETLGSQAGLEGWGTAAWMAPELVTDGGASIASDVYSFGMVLYELVTLSSPCEGQEWLSILRTLYLTPDLRPVLPDWAPPVWVNLINKCWATAVEDRPSMEEALAYLDTHREEMSTCTRPANFLTIVTQPAVTSLPDKEADQDAAPATTPELPPLEVVDGGKVSLAHATSGDEAAGQ
eukprot:TRINITY_DN1674_c0_g1_i3.p1 TRINITY_DN1674_c0_g1~~TRINITY_DN1674_c0_g1_i3.p1  ORF type:complete len:669 (-),score=14.04 TRINITY_DN1674_c0_g1_i3:24-2030(-)